MHPPYRVPGDELGRMSDQEIIARFGYEHHVDGSPKLPKLSVGQKHSPRKLFERRCFYLGVTEPEDVARLWAEAKANEPPNIDPRRRKRTNRG